MKRFLFLVVVLLTAFAFALPTYGQLAGDDPDLPVDLVRPPAHEMDPVQPLPRPVAPTGYFEADDPQLVGFTKQHFTGNAGVLNYSMACQMEFPGSRMCTLTEVSMTLVIPDALGGGFAWVQRLDGDAAVPAMNCNGWMSELPDDLGTSIELGECYGGQKLMPCNTRLAVACCSKSGRLPIR